MTLLEAISPTARALLEPANSGGGIVNAIVKNSADQKLRFHVANVNGAPVCGGGNAARRAQWQEVICDPDCQRCLQILEIRKLQPNKQNES